MLSSIKDKTKGWVAYLIVGLIIVPFALFGINEYSSGTANVIVASIDKEDISKEVYLKEFNTTKRRLQRELGEQYTPELDRRAKFSTISLMVNKHILEKLANELGYVITQRELQDFIQKDESFKVDGKFSIDRYKQLLRLNGLLESDYERMQTNELKQNQIKANFLNSAFITPSMLKRIYLLNEQQRKFDYMVLDGKDYSGKIKVKEQSMKEFFDKNKEKFFEPQKVTVDFVELSTEKMAKNVQANDDILFNFYQDEQARFSTEEERKAQHILVESQTLADEVVKQLGKGSSFAELAVKYSQDSGSKNNGGDLGFFTLGVMVPEFEAQVFAMKVGDVSAPIKTDFGYHIIKLNAIKVAKTKSFDEVRDELVTLYSEQEVQRTIYSLVEKLSQLAYESSLEEAADKMDLELKVSKPFTQDTKQYNAKFVKASYSDVVLNKGENSEVIEISKDKFVVLRINKKTPKRQKAFDEVKVEINRYLSNLSSKALVEDIANKVATLLNKNDVAAAEKIIDKHKLKWKKVGWVKRDSNQADIEIINHVFTLPKPKNGATYTKKNLSNNQSIVLKLSAVKAPEPSLDKVLSNTMLNLESETLFNSILKTLHKNSDIEIFANHL